MALERFAATSDGRTGGFLLQRSGTLDHGALTLSVIMAPESGTGALAGISGDMTIDASAGVHKYVLRYTLPEQ